MDAKWNKSERERYILHDNLYEESGGIKVKLKERSRKVVLRGWGLKGYKPSATRWIRSEDLMYNTVTLADNSRLYNWYLLREYNSNVLIQKKKKKPGDDGFFNSTILEEFFYNVYKHQIITMYDLNILKCY